LEPSFVGPAALALAQRYNMDNRDQERRSGWGCSRIRRASGMYVVGECTRVCPKHVDPAGAIQQYKLKAALEWVKSFVLPRGHDEDSTEVRS